MKKEPVIREKCGTTAGYQKHHWEKENPCERCLEANRLYVAKRRETPENKKRRAEWSRKNREANLEEYRRKEIASQAKRKDKKSIYESRYRAENREEINRRIREYRKANPELIKAQSADYYQRNKEKKARYRAANRERAKAWRQSNPELFRVYNHQRKARKLAVASEPYTTQQILDLYGTDCYLCLEPIDLLAPRRAGEEGWQRGLHLDHIIPLSGEGSDLIENVRPTHGQCNLSKHTTLLSALGI